MVTFEESETERLKVIGALDINTVWDGMELHTSRTVLETPKMLSWGKLAHKHR